MEQSKVNNENYYVVQGWMVKELHLKGNELGVYAIIYGFSQDGISKYTGGLKYLADWTNSTKQGCMNSLKSLVEKELIYKEEIEINNIKLCNYCANIEKLDTIKKSLIPIKESLMGGKKSLINNIYNNINNNNIIKEKINKKEKPTLEEIESYIQEKQLKVNGKQFFDYFETGNWIDSKGNKVKNWKQKLLTWNKYADNTQKKTTNYEQNDNTNYNNLYEN